MAYIPNEWKDQQVQRPKTYQMNTNDDGSVTLVDSFGLVTELGTPVNEDYMNHIEQGIAGAAIRYYNTTETFKNNEVVLNINTEGSVELWKSLTDNNLGNPLTDIEKWQAVDLGGSSSSGSGLSMFDLVVKDHILSYEESKGFGLQGTYVYKDAVPGSRYGYPDFYNRCVEEFEDDGNTLLSIKNNVSFVGAPVVDNGVLSEFSTSNYATALTFPTDEDFVFEFKIKTGADISSEQEIFACPTASGPAYKYYCLLNLNSNNLWIGFNGGEGVWSYGFATPAQPETDYIVKAVYSKTNNTLHVTMSLANGTVLLDDTKQVGELYDIKETVIGVGKDNGTTIFNPFKGSVDLKECYIESNSQRIWSGASVATKNPNGHIFYDIADKEVVDDWFDTYGIADFYGVDKENERIFLPRNSKFFQFTTDTTKVNDMVEAGLPNIEAKDSIGFSDDNPQSDLPPFVYAGNVGNTTGGSSPEKRFRFDASTANPIYGKSDTVQPPSSLKLLYYVVGNTDVQSAATDIVDVTTSENDTTPLFTGHYFNFKPNNPCWLKAGEQANNGGLYASTYSTLVQELTDPVYNLKVIKTEDMQAGVDYSLYWKVDQDAQTFTTPTKLGNEGMFSTACKGNGVTLGLTNGSGSYGFGYSTNAANYNQTNSGLYGTPIGTQLSGQPNNWPYNSSLGITPDPTKSGIVPHIEVPESWNLYFKVSNALENLEVINVGQILEALTDKLDKNHSNDTKPYIVEQYQNPNVGTAAGNAGYRKWSNGMMEQWASSDSIGPNSKTTISFLIPFYQNACVYAQQITGGHASSAGTWSVDAVSNNNFELINYTDVISAVYWFAIGRYQ